MGRWVYGPHMPRVRAEYELQPGLLDRREALAAELGDDARVDPLPSAAGPDLPPDGLLIELDVDEGDPLRAIATAARRLAVAFDAVGLPLHAVALECDGLPPVRIETRPQIHPFTG